MFPGDKTHKTADLQRIIKGAYSGSTIVQKDVADVALTSIGNTEVQLHSETFKAENVYYRKASNKLISYFIKGHFFKTVDDGLIGFKSKDKVSVFMKKTKDKNQVEGQIISPGTQVTFLGNSISKILLNGNPIAITNKGQHCVKVNIPKGTYAIELW